MIKRDGIKVELKILIDRGLKKELEGASEYADEPLSWFCERLMRDRLSELQRIEMEY